MDRRTFIIVLVALCGCGKREEPKPATEAPQPPPVADPQQAGKVYRIGYLSPANSQDVGYTALQRALGELGYGVGRNLIVEERFANGELDRLPGFATELTAAKVDIIVAVSPSAIRAARDATKTIPIVMAFSGDDPVKAGFVASLARPGGNITGMTSLTGDLVAKWIEFLLEVIPGVRRMAVLRSPVRPDHTEQIGIMQALAAPRGIELQVAEARGLEEYDAAFAAMTRERAEAVIILSGPEYMKDIGRLAELAAAHRLPAVFQYGQFVLAGGLLSYGPDIGDLSARAAVYVDKILKGGSPGELAVQQPTQYNLDINMKTAKALGLTIPKSMQLRAHKVIR